MPDHVHALLRGLSEASDIARSIARWKQFTGYWFSQRNDDRLWEPGFWDRVIREDDDPAYFVHYIVMNPVRRRLVSVAQEYRWLGSSVFSRDELVRIATDFESGNAVSLL
jgi:putative transposase